MSATGLALPGALTQPMSRRALLQAGGTLAGALALGAGGSLLTAGTDSLAGLRRSDYLPYVGSTLHLQPPGHGPVPVRLEAVEDPTPSRPPGDREAEFLLVFRLAAWRAPLGQDVMDVQHPAGYTRSLLVTPIGRRGLALGAIVNRTSPIRSPHGR